MADIQAIANQLSELTVMEAAQLSKLLEEKWGVSAAAAAPMMMAAAGGPAAGGAAAPAARLVRLFGAPGSQLARVLKAHADKEEGAAAQS